MSARYDRFIENYDFTKNGDTTAKIAKLVDAIKKLRPACKDPEYAYDIHLREKSEIMVYHGGTCLLVINLSRLSNGQISFKSKSYEKERDKPKDKKCPELFKGKECVEAFALLKTVRNVENMELIIERVSKFLNYAVSTVSDKFYHNNHSEGYWSSKLSIDYGRNWTPDDEWLIIDREAVIGFNQTIEKKASEEKTEFYNAIKQVVESTKKNQKFSAWGDLSKSFGDELDFLAIGREGQLLCIELKHGNNTSGIYWGPLQATVYQEAFEKKISEISKSILVMVQQKIELGLLPPAACERIPADGFKVVKGILAVADTSDNLKSECWQRAYMVNGLLERPVSMVRSLTKSGNMGWKSFP
ncbi:MAG: hypothetical protein PHI31_14040 [Desulfuromonadaceae bacterium]|nr:hypothetical protein [Desulfuromonadaceae bacterium]